MRDHLAHECVHTKPLFNKGNASVSKGIYEEKMSSAEGYIVVFDLETQGKICDQVGSTENERISNLQISCLSAIKIPTNALFFTNKDEVQEAISKAEMKTWWRDVDEHGKGPFDEFFEWCDGAEIIGGYNSLHFDHPILLKHVKKRRYERHVCKALDSFARIKDVTGVFFKLDALLKANGLETKTANGLQAIKFWEDQERDKLQEYCEQDVRACARLMALPTLKLPNTTSTLPNYVFGLQSAVAAHRASASVQAMQCLAQPAKMQKTTH